MGLSEMMDREVAMKKKLHRYRSAGRTRPIPVIGPGIRKYYTDLHTQHYLRLLVTILISFITTAILIYPEEFRLGPYPFSFLGCKHTPSGLRNIYSRLVFDLGMFLCAYTMYMLARHFSRRHPVPESQVYEFLSYMSAAGFLLMVVPCDVPEVRFLHSFGSAFVVAAHLFMSLIRVVAVQHHLQHHTVLVLLAVLLVSVLLYAAMWVLNLPWHPLVQKPAFAAIIYVELRGSSLSRFYGEEGVFGQVRSQQIH